MKIQENKPKTFLALTALEAFWNPSQPMLFLGEWCKLYNRKSIWEALDATMLQSSKLNYANSFEACEYATAVYEKLLPELTDWLNAFHGTHHSLKYWRLLVGPFLFLYTQVVYARFLYLQAAFDENPDLETYGLSQQTFFTPMNTNEFVCLARESDEWNLQIFTQLLDQTFKRPISYKKISWDADLQRRKSNFCNVSYKPRTKFLLSILQFIYKKRPQMVGILSGFSTNDLFKLMFKSGFRILPVLPTIPINRGQTLGLAAVSKNKIDMQKRKQLLDISVDEELEKLVINTLPINMPINFIEEYQTEVETSRKYFPYTNNVILLDQISGYDQYKFWMGERLEKGAKLICIQHGGCYGMQKAHAAEFLECHVSDFFISWGWSYSNNVVPASLPHINKQFAKYFRKKKDNSEYSKILWVATQSDLRYELAIRSMAITSKPYLDYQKRFFTGLTEKVSSQVCMRLNPASTNMEEVQEYLHGLNIYKPENRESFFTNLGSTKIVIIDNLSTTFLYTLAFNIPTILFWDKEFWALRDEAKPYFADLERVGIYYHSPEDAAIMLNNIADDQNAWWYSQSVQTARQQFCDNFARISDNYLSEWKSLLLRL